MKRFAGILVMIMCVMASSICFAEVSYDRVAVGGITPGASIDYVQSIYGAPDGSRSGPHPLWKGTIIEYQYGNSLFITFREGYAINVVVTKNNGIGTPDGVTVGMNASVITDIYGEPDRVFNNQNYVYNDETSYALVFKTQNGKIISVGCGSFD